MEQKMPNHVAIIMDGNGRWAQKRGLKRTKGHQKGAEVLKRISEYVYDKKIKVLSVFAFSTTSSNVPTLKKAASGYSSPSCRST